MPSLDAHTLAAVSALAAFFMAVTMGGIYLAGNREPAIADWALAGILFCLGHVMGSFTLAGVEWVDRRFALGLSNAAVVLGYGLVLLGIQQHLGMKRWTGTMLALGASILLATSFLPVMYENAPLRVGVLTAIYSGLSIVALVLLWRAGEPPLQAYRRAVGIVLCVNAAVLIARAVYILWHADDSASGAPPGVLVPVFLSAVLFFMALNVSLALMLFRRKEVHLRFLARHDALTGLLNRYSLDEFAARELARARRGEHDVSLVVLDLDNFKQVNDRFGHAAGDQVLVQAAQRIHQVIREGDIAFRVGGEEFLILLPGASGETAQQVAERLRLELVERPFDCLQGAVTVSTSVGVVTYDPVSDDWKGLLRRADRALYRAKGMGRNRVEVARDSRVDDGETAGGF